METEVFTVNIDQLNMNKIRDVADAITNGQIVAFPTDTIYGMGCDVFNEEAVEKLYEIKGRPKRAVGIAKPVTGFELWVEKKGYR